MVDYSNLYASPEPDEVKSIRQLREMPSLVLDDFLYKLTDKEKKKWARRMSRSLLNRAFNLHHDQRILNQITDHLQ